MNVRRTRRRRCLAPARHRPRRPACAVDVYMDDTYRRIAVDTLMELCASQPTRQFIFITPQDMHPFLKDRDTLPKITRMADVRPA